MSDDYAAGDFTFVADDPPALPEMAQNLALAADNPGKWCRLVTYKKAGTAATMASHLRKGRRYPERAEGTWEFMAEDVGDGNFAIKAKFTPPST